MTDKLKKARVVTDLLSWFSLYFALVSFVLCFIDDTNRQYITALIMLLPFAGTVILCLRAANMAIYAGYHILLILLIWLFQKTSTGPGIAQCCAVTAAVVIQMIVFFAKRVKKNPQKRFLYISPVLAVLFFILWILADGLELSSLTSVLPAVACIYMLCSVLGIYLTNIISYIESNREMANMPVFSLIRSGNGLMAIFMVLALAAILLFTHAGLDRLLHQLKNLLLSGIRFAFSFAPNTTETVSVPSETSAPVSQAPEFFQEGEASPVMVAVSDFFTTVIQIILIIGAAALIIFLIYQLWQRFNGFSFKKREKKDDKTMTDDVIEKLTAPAHPRRTRFFGPGMPQDKIRRIYYKKIQSHYKKEAVQRSLTPKELTESINPSDPQAAQQFTQIYEQARYSRNPGNNDPAAYKNLAKKL